MHIYRDTDQFLNDFSSNIHLNFWIAIKVYPINLALKYNYLNKIWFSLILIIIFNLKKSFLLKWKKLFSQKNNINGLDPIHISGTVM